MTCKISQKITTTLDVILDAMAIYYGALLFTDVVNILKQHYKMQFTEPELIEQILLSLEQCRYATKQAYYLAHKRVSNPGVLLDAINKAKTDTQTYAIVPGHALKNIELGAMPQFSTHHDEFIAFVHREFGVDAIASRMMLNDIMLQMNLDWSQTRVMQALPKSIVPNSEKQNKDMIRLLALVYQHTPRWLLMGHTPNDLYVPQESMNKPQLPFA